MISGGTNSLTGQLARKYHVDFNGITIGTHARKVITKFESKPDEISDENLKKALINAKKLILKNLQS